jgi:hypothetical protein
MNLRVDERLVKGRATAESKRPREFRISEGVENCPRTHKVLLDLGVVAPECGRTPCGDVCLQNHNSMSTGISDEHLPTADSRRLRPQAVLTAGRRCKEIDV